MTNYLLSLHSQNPHLIKNRHSGRNASNLSTVSTGRGRQRHEALWGLLAASLALGLVRDLA